MLLRISIVLACTTILLSACKTTSISSSRLKSGYGQIEFQKKNPDDLKTYYAIINEAQYYEFDEFLKSIQKYQPQTKYEEQEIAQRELSKYLNNLKKGEEADINKFLAEREAKQEYENMQKLKANYKVKLVKAKDGKSFYLPEGERYMIIGFDIASGEKSKKQYIKLMKAKITGYEKYILTYSGSGKKRYYYIRSAGFYRYN